MVFSLIWIVKDCTGPPRVMGVSVCVCASAWTCVCTASLQGHVCACMCGMCVPECVRLYLGSYRNPLERVQMVAEGSEPAVRSGWIDW